MEFAYKTEGLYEVCLKSLNKTVIDLNKIGILTIFFFLVLYFKPFHFKYYPIYITWRIK